MSWRRKPAGYRALGVSWHDGAPFGWTLIVSLWRWEFFWHPRPDEAVLEELRSRGR